MSVIRWPRAATLLGDFPALLTSLLMVIALSLLAVHLIKEVVAWKRQAPGPWGFPIVGHLHLLGKFPQLTFLEMAKRYGDVFRIRVGKWPTLVLNGRDAINECLLRQGRVFAGRPAFYSHRFLARGKRGFTMNNYSERWELQHKLIVAAFKQMPSSKIQDTTVKHTSNLIQQLRQECSMGAPVDPSMFITRNVANIIYSLSFGNVGLDPDDDNNWCFLYSQVKDFLEFQSTSVPVDFLPWTRFFYREAEKRFMRLSGTLERVFRVKLEEHQRTYEEGATRDILDAIISLSRTVPEETKKRLSLSTEDILFTAHELLGPGFDTISSALQWAVLYMAAHPEVQRKVHAEIDKVLQDGRQPTMRDAIHMPYVQACILEVCRCSAPTPLGLPHSTIQDTTVNGCFVPKDTLVLVNYWSISYDENVFEESNLFYPERFLRSDNTIDSEKAKVPSTYGKGKRRCVGESLARVELFIIFTSLLQQFSFEKPPGTEINKLGDLALTYKPHPHKYVIRKR